MMTISLIWAMAQNRTIGVNNSLPWRLPEDLKNFKALTTGKPVIMGRKTWDSLGRPLPNRDNIVITRNPDLTLEGALVVASLEEGIELAKSKSPAEVMVIGGAEIYAQSLPMADRLYITLVHAEVDGDAHFPEFDLSVFKEIQRQDFRASEGNPYDYSFVTLEKV